MPPSLIAWAPVLLAIEKYDVKPVAEPYWSRSFRDLCALWLVTALEEGVFDEIEDAFPEARLRALVDHLHEPTSEPVLASDRKFALGALKAYFSRGKRSPPSQPLHEFEDPSPEECSTWPYLHDVEDLATSTGGLRVCASTYLLNHFRRFDVVMITFDVARRPPILIHVPRARHTAAREELQRMDSNGDFSPCKVAEVVSTWEKLTVQPEQAASCGTGLSTDQSNLDQNHFGGSIACFVQRVPGGPGAHARPLAITAAHVVQTQKHGVEEVLVKCKIRTVDIALLKLKPDVFCSPFVNNLALRRDTAQNAQPGRIVYKFGAATGLTIGLLQEVNFAIDGYQNASVILPRTVDEQISAAGDSGALWVYECDGVYYPLGIHVTTGEYTEPGCRGRPCAIALPFAMQYLEEKLQPEWEFVCPPQAATQPHTIERLRRVAEQYRKPLSLFEAFRTASFIQCRRCVCRIGACARQLPSSGWQCGAVAIVVVTMLGSWLPASPYE